MPEVNLTAYQLAQTRISSFQSNPNFKDYDIYFLSGIVEGLNERRRAIKCLNAETRCSTTNGGLFDPTSLDLTWEINLVTDIIQASEFGDNHSFVGSKLDFPNASGALLSKRLINLLRYYTVETSFGALTTRNVDYLDLTENLYQLGVVLLPTLNDNRYFGQVYRTFNSNTKKHYPCSDPFAGSSEQFSNPAIATRKAVVNVAANPDIRNDTNQGLNPTFYDAGTDLNINQQSGYPGNGDLEIVRTVKSQRNVKSFWPVLNFQGKLVDPKTLSQYNAVTYPEAGTTDAWALWTNKKELFKYESEYYASHGIRTDFVMNNEYLSSIFPELGAPSGLAFMGIREHFLEIISAISKMKYFAVPARYAPRNSGENAVLTDVTTVEGRKQSDWGGCLYAPATCCGAGCGQFKCSFVGGPVCCSLDFPPIIFPQLECGDCGAYKCSPNGCQEPALSPQVISTGSFNDPFGGPNPPYYTKTAEAKADFQGGGFGFLVGDGCPINTLLTRSREQMREKILVFDCHFTGTLVVPYRLDKFGTKTCDGFAIDDGCVASITSITEYKNDTFSFPESASTNGLGGSKLTDYTIQQPIAVAPFNNCAHTCLPSRNGGGGETKEYRQYMGNLSLAIPKFTMIPSDASV